MPRNIQTKTKVLLVRELRSYVLKHTLSVSYENILAKMADIDDFLLPDISSEDKDFENIGNFDKISFDAV